MMISKDKVRVAGRGYKGKLEGSQYIAIINATNLKFLANTSDGMYVSKGIFPLHL